MNKDKFKPVPHDAKTVARWMQDPEFKAAYDALDGEYAALAELLRARQEAGLTQAEVAQRMGTTNSAVSRLEASLLNLKHTPSLATLRKYAAACGKKLEIRLV